MEKQSIENNPSKPVSWFLNSPNSTNHPIGYGYGYHDLIKEMKQYPCYEQKGIGVALEEDEEISKAANNRNRNRKMVLFGAELKKVRIPEPDVVELKSPSDFGIKTKNSPQHLDLSVKSERFIREREREREGRLSLKEMEMSEEYTCVMKHGNDPKIVHIFDDVIVETCFGGGNLFVDDEFKREGNNGNSEVEDDDDFLGICYNCKVKLGDDKDIFMYRGEKSFCSSECRFQEMIRDQDVDYY